MNKELEKIQALENRIAELEEQISELESNQIRWRSIEDLNGYINGSPHNGKKVLIKKEIAMHDGDNGFWVAQVSGNTFEFNYDAVPKDAVINTNKYDGWLDLDDLLKLNVSK